MTRTVDDLVDWEAVRVARRTRAGQLDVDDAGWVLAGLVYRSTVPAFVAGAHLQALDVPATSQVSLDLAGELQRRLVDLVLGPGGLEVLTYVAQGGSMTQWLLDAVTGSGRDQWAS